MLLMQLLLIVSYLLKSLLKLLLKSQLKVREILRRHYLLLSLELMLGMLFYGRQLLLKQKLLLLDSLRPGHFLVEKGLELQQLWAS
jgi:hypothetical protein